MHSDLMLVKGNNGIFLKEGAYQKLVLGWYHTETINKKWESPETNINQKQYL